MSHERTATNTGTARRPFLKTLAVAGFALGTGTGLAAASSHSEPVALLADQDVEVGTVSATADGDTLSVEYVITDPDWELTGTNLHVGDIPTNGPGNPKVGHFDFYSEHEEEPVSSYTHEVDVSELSGVVDVAAHATVQTEVEVEVEVLDEETGEPIVDEETGEVVTETVIEIVEESAWGDGERINDRRNRNGNRQGNWATKFTYDLGE